jgi:zinc/manganese transport system substrate-binding protein
VAIGALVVAVLLAACSTTSTDSTPSTAPGTSPGTVRTGPPLVVTSTALVGALVRSVAGDEVDVRVLAEPGDDPTAMTIDDPGAALADAELVVLVDAATYERGLDGLARAADAQQVPVLALAPDLGPIPLGGSQLDAGATGTDGATDPYVWLDPDRWTQAARAVGDALVSLDGVDAAAVQGNVAAFDEAVAGADEDLQAAFATVPADRRALVTDLPGLGYLADRYGFELITAGDPAAVVAAATSRGAPAVFTAADRAKWMAEALGGSTPVAIVALDLDGAALGPVPDDPVTATAAYVDLLVGTGDAIRTATTS